MTDVVGARTRQAGVWQGILLLAGSCMPVLGSVLITPVLPQLSQHFAQEPAAEILVPMIVAIPALMIALFAPFAGQIVDRAGRKKLLIGALVLYSLVGTAPVWLEGLTEILVSRVLVGLCEAAIMTVCTTLIVDYFHEEKRRKRYLGLQTVTTTLAATVFIVLGGALGAGGWHVPFWVYVAGVVIAVPMLFSLWEPGAESSDTLAREGERIRIPWRDILAPVLVTLFGGFVFYVLIIEVSYLVVGTGISAENTGVIGGIAAAASLATAIGGLLFARMTKVRPTRLLPIAFGLQAVGMTLIGLIPSLPGVIAGAVIASFGSGLLLPSLLTWAVSTTRFEDRGRVTGWWTASFYLGQFLTPILMGAIAAVGALSTGVAVVGIAAAIMAIVVLVALRGRRDAVVTDA
ncbi:MFS transporter [Microbacterium protaetiae]|uniref:MFS transporter n=1 Tax=Microbacterium protaetiae TaxID=2509458 RepID=A0A4P6EB95_9MICO|nr:MFS transporter [Microbacterium protaetiae]QAY59284.1 MFS transporter [Microbacterium protaetiae]